MSNLADRIETYIKRLIEASPNATLILQRRELADRFECVPSQINYVLQTRFTAERGYVVESRRGGGGFLRIRRLDMTRERVMQLLAALHDATQGVSRPEALDFVSSLLEARLITRRESQLMKCVLSQDVRKQEDLHSAMFIRMLEVLLQDS